MTPRCRATKRNGKPCTLPATAGDGFCWGHHPANREQRRRNASRGGKGRPTREVADLKCEVKEIIATVKDGSLDRNVAVVAFQGYRVLHGYIELERRIREQDEILERLAALEGAAGQTGEVRRGQAWHR